MIQELRSLKIEEKVGQLFMIGIAGPEIDSDTEKLLEEISPGGVCLFSRNVREAAQTRETTDHLRASLPVDPLIAIDQEGGLVDRLRRIVTPMPPAGKMRSASDASLLANLIAETLLVLGVNWDFAPVVDVVDERRSGYPNGLASRTFGSTAEDVVQLTAAFLTALQDNGVLGCLKHFPGLGASRVDSHEELPLVEIEEIELRSVDLFPYERLFEMCRVGAVMVAHAAYPKVSLQEVDQDGKLLPSSLSYNFVTSLLRDELGFDGLVITDDIEMGAIVKNYGVGDACKRAIRAGSDMLSICADPAAIREGYYALTESVRDGEIDIERIHKSLDRIAKIKGHLFEPLPFDPLRLTRLSNEIAELNSRSGRS